MAFIVADFSPVSMNVSESLVGLSLFPLLRVRIDGPVGSFLPNGDLVAGEVTSCVPANVIYQCLYILAVCVLCEGEEGGH